MIISYHPLFSGDKKMLCAGREPDQRDVAAMSTATAIILPQGCKHSLYDLARKKCRFVFPNYDMRFQYPGKIGQIKLFRYQHAPCPATRTFADLETFNCSYTSIRDDIFRFPFVFKFNWGGEGDTVFLIRSEVEFDRVLHKAFVYEQTGQAGFLIQEYIPQQHRILRVVVIYKRVLSYWRVKASGEELHSAVAKGGSIDTHTDPHLRKIAEQLTARFCAETGIQLAGFDLLIAPETQQPLFLEINYFFGRRGLGGSQMYYALLEEQVTAWLNDIQRCTNSTR